MDRAEKTVAKALRGGLPAPTKHTMLIGMGPGRPCDGCNETIGPTEKRYTASVIATLPLRFHHECYEAWAKLEH